MSSLENKRAKTKIRGEEAGLRGRVLALKQTASVAGEDQTYPRNPLHKPEDF